MRWKKCDHSTRISEFFYLNEENEIRLVIIKLSLENINVAFNKRKKTIFIKYKTTLSNLAPNI